MTSVRWCISIISLSPPTPLLALPPSLPLSLSLSPSLPQGAVGSEKNWSQMRKQVYDNMSSYLARKEERLRVRAGQGISELVQEPDTETSAEPPDKKLRIDSNQ